MVRTVLASADSALPPDEHVDFNGMHGGRVFWQAGAATAHAQDLCAGEQPFASNFNIMTG